MKKFLMAAVVFLLFTAQVEAVPFTRTQLDKMFLDVEQVQTESTLNLNVETFTQRGNGNRRRFGDGASFFDKGLQNYRRNFREHVRRLSGFGSWFERGGRKFQSADFLLHDARRARRIDFYNLAYVGVREKHCARS